MARFVRQYRGENGEVPQQLDLLQRAQDMLYEAEQLEWHHCPPGTIEGDHYSKLEALCRALEKEYA